MFRKRGIPEITGGFHAASLQHDPKKHLQQQKRHTRCYEVAPDALLVGSEKIILFKGSVSYFVYPKISSSGIPLSQDPKGRHAASSEVRMSKWLSSS